MKYSVFLLLPLIFSGNALATCGGVSCTGVKITRIVVESDGGTVISTSGDESKLSCDAGSNGYIKLDPSSKNYDSVYSLILTAHTTEHPIWVRTTDSGVCKLIYAVSDK
ncbi:hypothetical protein [Pseudoalteromonas ardens]|uniref:hypothetical protein n=1 Tax=Pseudoalteromonas ardens TaxID=3048490 RepID=UPI000A45308F|nr:hypothetical protein [Pseudoalteromonas sp. R96]MDK1311239.1 hypothetical protein [Pseudoalteromonas sp. R96]